MPADPDRLVTPEAVPLQLEVAGIGSRLIGAFVDALIQTAILIAGFVAGSLSPVLGEGFGLVVAGIAFFTLVVYAYHGVFEGLWDGRTPGKSVAGIRVVSGRGQPATWGQIVIRSIFRLIDMSPVGVISIIVTRRSQRLGDLAAGTIVIREHRQPAPAALQLAPDDRRDELARSLDTSAVTEREYSLVRDFLRRRATLSSEARSRLAAQLCGSLQSRIGRPGAGVDSETYLEAVIVSIRARSAERAGER